VLIFVRHGRTPNNAQALLQGQEDSPLDGVGRLQARRAGELIRRSWSVDEVVTSALTRTRQTAAEAGLDGYPSSVDDRWGEIDFGAYDRRRIAEVVHHMSERWAADIEYRPPGGESMGSLFRRVSEACEELLHHHPDRTVVVVSHATPIKAAAVWALGGSAPMILRLRISLCSITVVERTPMGLLLSAFNDVRHLHGV
jgi:broad specificity phosphatase PhoE